MPYHDPNHDSAPPLFLCSPILSCGSISHIRFFDDNQEVVRATSKNILVVQKRRSYSRTFSASSTIHSGGTHQHHPAKRFHAIFVRARLELRLLVENMMVKADWLMRLAPLIPNT